MLKVIIATVAMLATGVQASSGWSFAQRKCAKGVYCAEKMVCIQRVDRPYPRGMQPDYYQQIISIRSFKSVKKTGEGRVLVDSLQINPDPVGPDAITLEDAKDQAQFEYGNYGSPLFVRGKNVRLYWGTTSNFSEGVRFKITSSRQTRSGRVDTLVGKEKIVGSVVGDLTTSYECEALVVEAPSRVDDLTAP